MENSSDTNAKTIAMWSGPRNLSTAMMRAFENRADCAVWDEPFYAAFLAETGLDHPMRETILAAGNSNAALVADACLAPPPDGASLYYQKHMTHHMVADFPRNWLTAITNVFLIRDPARVAASYEKKRELVELEDIGVIQQRDIFRHVANAMGTAPIVIDTYDILQNPAAMIKALCAKMDIAFDAAMLNWPKGPRDSDGVWAPHWYHAVVETTGFAPPETNPLALSSNARKLADAAMPYYAELKQYALKA